MYKFCSFFIEKNTPATRCPDVPTFSYVNIPKESGLTNLRIIWEPKLDGFAGSHFFAKYRLRGETIPLQTDPEKFTNEIEVLIKFIKIKTCFFNFFIYLHFE